jgi:hypothetical protein
LYGIAGFLTGTFQRDVPNGRVLLVQAIGRIPAICHNSNHICGHFLLYGGDESWNWTVLDCLRGYPTCHSGQTLDISFFIWYTIKSYHIYIYIYHFPIILYVIVCYIIHIKCQIIKIVKKVEKKGNFAAHNSIFWKMI